MSLGSKPAEYQQTKYPGGKPRPGVGRKRGTETASTAHASRSPSHADLAWAAGFIEGEGYFHSARDAKFPYAYHAIRVGATQMETEPLERLLAIFGGRIRRSGKSAFGAKRQANEWNVYGGRARGVMLTLHPFMCARRQGQIELAMRRNLGLEDATS